MRTLTRRTLAATAVAGLLAIPVSSAGAASDTSDSNQVLTGTLGGEVSIDSTPANEPNFPLPTTGHGIGSIVVSANESYTLSVASVTYDKMTGWNSSTAAYEPDRQLLASMSLTAAADLTTSTTTATGAAVPAVSTTPATLATNALTGVLAGTELAKADTYNLTAIQDAGITDPAGDYRIELIYTISSPL